MNYEKSGSERAQTTVIQLMKNEQTAHTLKLNIYPILSGHFWIRPYVLTYHGKSHATPFCPSPACTLFHTQASVSRSYIRCQKPR